MEPVPPLAELVKPKKLAQHVYGLVGRSKFDPIYILNCDLKVAINNLVHNENVNKFA